MKALLGTLVVLLSTLMVTAVLFGLTAIAISGCEASRQQAVEEYRRDVANAAVEATLVGKRVASYRRTSGEIEIRFEDGTTIKAESRRYYFEVTAAAGEGK